MCPLPLPDDPESIETQQASEMPPVTEKSSTSELRVMAPTKHDAINFKELVDEGCGSEHYELVNFVAKGNERVIYKARPISKQAKEWVGVVHKDQTSGSVDVEQPEKATDDYQWVAIKILNLTPDRRLRISREIKIMKRYKQHPNLVRLVSSHLHKKDNTVWIAVEWVEGQELGRIVDDHTREARKMKVSTPALDEGQTRKLAVLLFKTLAVPHSMGCTHEDIHTMNIMMKQDTPVLIDFGDGTFDAKKMGTDVLMLTYALVECCVKPVIDADCRGPIPLMQYDSNRIKAMRKVLGMVVDGEFEVPEGMRVFVKDILEGLKNTTTANDPLIQQHPFLTGREPSQVPVK